MIDLTAVRHHARDRLSPLPRGFGFVTPSAVSRSAIVRVLGPWTYSRNMCRTVSASSGMTRISWWVGFAHGEGQSYEPPHTGTEA